MVFLAATGNRGKLAELQRILSALGHETRSPDELGLRIEVEETAQTFEGNARLKAEAFCRASGLPSVADDSGLAVDALGGAPGVYTARYAGPNASDTEKMQKLLRALEGVPCVKRTARFVSAVCCVFPDGRRIETRGACEGFIAPEIVPGPGGFGYDPVFIERSTGVVFSQLSAAQKDAVSHRGRALAAFSEKLAALRLPE